MISVSAQSVSGQDMVETERLIGLGRMAGAISHDFKNILSGIMGNAELAMRHAEGVPAVKEQMQHVVTLSRWASDLSEQLWHV